MGPLASSTCGEPWMADKLIGSRIWESSDGLPRRTAVVRESSASRTLPLPSRSN
ncbi:hypothetical protein JG687_00014983 [Phytophthora cactorum]|uniref:Uncharacterized protein n=1 Tax=Phytophthora cactorum TaxID=29920 RepID=A0A8T1TY02_9STRA|nr:hypothetical protein JG687_00014983 [Phytophthora cactorum]